MGVTGLWKLIEPCGHPVPVDTLEGKILAVDISIWLHQVVKGFQDNKGAALNNAHLLGLFHRLCKLMYYRVKPVFVFDGCVPQLKRDTIARRQQQRNKLTNEADRIQALLLQSLAKEKIVQMALGPNAEMLLTSPVKKKPQQTKDDSVDDMFKLPEIPQSSVKDNKTENDERMDDSWEDSFNSSENYTTTSATDSSYDECNPRDAYSSNLQAIDVRSNDFKQLPADVRHDILVDIKETRKQSSWGRLHELPSQRDEFSTFQMKRLLKRRQVQVSLEEAEKEMGNDHALTYSELTNIFTEEGILESEALKKSTKQISSSENTRYLLVRDLKKKTKCDVIKEEVDKTLPDQDKDHSVNEKTSSSSKVMKPIEVSEKYISVKEETPASSNVKKPVEISLEKTESMDDEHFADIQLAIALSLHDETEAVYNEKDYDFHSGEALKLNKHQRKELQNAAKGPAAAYMIEYGGLNKDEVNGIMDKTQIDDVDVDDVERLIRDIEESDSGKPLETEKSSHTLSQEICLRVSDDSDSTDSDLEEVEETTAKPVVSITLDIAKAPALEDDLFADVFKEDECVIEETPEFLPNKKNEKQNENDADDGLFSQDLKSDKCDSIQKDSKNENDEDEIMHETKPEDYQLKSDNKSICQLLNKNTEILSILDEVRNQKNEIKNINLDSIKLESTIVEISDDEVPPCKPVKEAVTETIKDEIIEICDSGDELKLPITPSNISDKSPKQKTPSKNHSITEFFNVNYKVKRTPDKPDSEEVEKPNKVQSPFFVKKSPRSGAKSKSSSPVNANKMSKASKNLFEEENKDQPESNKNSLDDGIEPLTLQEMPSEGDVIKEAADLLKSKKSTNELSSLADNLAKERRDLETERNRQDRMGMSISQRMNSDCQELLRLFGVPFIVAPMEAEAQCAFLDLAQLTNGTITDDSDIWLFGGRTVYKNFFAQNKHVMEFQSEKIEKVFSCDRKKLIQLACLVGSDYTTGIHGIGAVTALEILASFTPKETTPETNNFSTIQNTLATLQRFRTWWQSMKAGATSPGTSARHALQKKLKNIEVIEGFPNIAVIEAYLAPTVDDNKEAISWGYPDIESLREFARKNFGWTNSKTDDILMPVIKKLNERTTQQSIRNYFSVKNTFSSREVQVSKRVKNAINKMMFDEETPEKPKKAKVARISAKANSKRKKDLDKDDKQINDIDNDADKVGLSVEPCSSSQMARGPLNKAIKRSAISYAAEKIPQREKTIEEMEAKKAHAAEILKKTSKDVKRKRKT